MIITAEQSQEYRHQCRRRRGQGLRPCRRHGRFRRHGRHGRHGRRHGRNAISQHQNHHYHR